jgi:predicted SnoaL-like aldol condensation-catalyzing enzyme
LTEIDLTQSNRKVLLDFVDLFYRQRRVREAFERHVADAYIQHNPNILDGREAAIIKLEPLFGSPDSSFDIQRILVDGEFGVIHLHGRRSRGERGGSVVDLYRLDGGKIVEHWDVMQPVPESAVNPRPMF